MWYRDSETIKLNCENIFLVRGLMPRPANTFLTTFLQYYDLNVYKPECSDERIAYRGVPDCFYTWARWQETVLSQAKVI